MFTHRKLFLSLTVISCLILTLTLIEVIPAQTTTTWYVDDSVSSSGDGTSWEIAFKTIQEGIDTSIDGDIVLVASGTYYESINFNGKDISVKSESGAENTIIDGGRDEENIAIVTFRSGETQDAILDGFTVRSHKYHGIFYWNSSSKIINNIISGNGGLGIYCTHSSFANIDGNTVGGNGWGGIECSYSSSSTITNNTIAGNGLYYGVMIDDSSSATITDNTITGNELYGIGSSSPSVIITDNVISGNGETGIICSSSPVISNNIIIGNYGYYSGIVCGSSATITYNIISGNVGDAIICNSSSSPTVLNNTINGNGGKGINCFSSSFPTITNNIITSNGGDGIYADIDSYPVISYNDVWNNGEDTNGNGIGDEDYGGYATSGEGDISTEPLFEGVTVSIPQDYLTIAEGINACNGFRLSQDSPCIGAASDGTNLGRYPAQEEYGLPGDFIVYVSSGKYTENFYFTPFVQLIGEGASSTLLDGAGETITTIVGGNTTGGAIKGFTIQNGRYGIYCYASLSIVDNVIVDNQSDGIFCVYASPTIANNIVTRNGSAGIHCYANSSAFITNNTIADNGGSGIYCSFSSSPSVTNNILTNNEGYGIKAYVSSTYPSHPISSYNDIWNNSSGDYGGDASSGEGDIFEDPLFVNPDNGDFHLQEGSLCIDAGTNEAFGLPETDFEGDTRIIDGDNDGQAIVDMGADEYRPEADLVPDIEVTPLRLKKKLTQGQSAKATFYIYNHGQGELKFKIRENTSWLAINPRNGTVASQDMIEIEIDFDATDLEPGVYITKIKVKSNDPDESVVKLSVRVKVVIS